MGHQDSLDIIIPKATYVAFQKTATLPTGYMAADGDDAAARKRRQQVETWARYKAGTEGALEPKSFENKPMSGFKFGGSTFYNRGWGKGEQAWEVEDPRGFRMMVSGQNMAQIMAVTTIENGEILEKCVWGKLASENVLIPITSDVFKRAEKNTERVSKRVSLRDVKPGNKIITHDAITGIYLGSMYGIVKAGYGHAESQLNFSNKRYLIAMLKDDGSWKAISEFSSIKVSEVLDDTVIAPKELEQKVNTFILGGGSVGGYRTVAYVSKLPDESVNLNTFKFKLVETTAEACIKLAAHVYGRTIVASIDADLPGQETWLTQDIGSFRPISKTGPKTTVTGTIFVHSVFDETGRFEYLKETISTTSWRSYAQNKTITYDVTDDNVKYYDVVSDFTSELGNPLKLVV